MEKKVKVYSTPTCTNCREAKKYLTERGIEFESYDVTRDSDALQEMKTISKGARTVPVISVCGKVLVGYDRSALDEALKCLD